MSKFCICYVSDYKYWKHLYVSIKSLREKNKEISIYVFHKDFSEKLLIKFKNFKLNLKFMKIKPKHLRAIKNKRSIMYFRYFIPQYLKNYKKILYIDLDTIIKGNLKNIFKIKLNKFPIAVVKEPLPPKKNLFHNLKDYKYRFNTGVILFNVKAWNKSNLLKKFINLSNKNHLKDSTDQPVMNSLLYKKVKLIDKKWNYLDSYEFTDLNKAKIIHFNRHKPWLIKHKSQFKSQYNKYRKEIDNIIIPDDFNIYSLLQLLKKKI